MVSFVFSANQKPFVICTRVTSFALMLQVCTRVREELHSFLNQSELSIFSCILLTGISPLALTKSIYYYCCWCCCCYTALYSIKAVYTKKKNNNNNKSHQSWDIQKQYASRLKSIAWVIHKCIHHCLPTFVFSCLLFMVIHRSSEG